MCEEKRPRTGPLPQNKPAPAATGTDTKAQDENPRFSETGSGPQALTETRHPNERIVGRVMRLRVGLGAATFRVLMALAWNADPITGRAQLSVAALTEETEAARRTVQRCLRRLERRGLIAADVPGFWHCPTVWQLMMTPPCQRGRRRGE